LGVLEWETTGIVAAGAKDIPAGSCVNDGGGNIGEYDSTCIAGTATVEVAGAAAAVDADSDCAGVPPYPPGTGTPPILIEQVG
jgi:hypothetical protein